MVQKENISDIEIPSFDEEDEKFEYGRSDEVHSKKILKLFQHKCYRTEAGLVMYDDKFGIWCYDKEDHRRIMSSVSRETFVNLYKYDEEKSFDGLFSSAYKLISCCAPFMENFQNHTLDSGFLCFSNGVLDMKNIKMLPQTAVKTHRSAHVA